MTKIGRSAPGEGDMGIPATETVDSKLRDVTQDQVLRVAEKYLNPIMTALRKERGRRTIDQWGSFNLPLEHHPGRLAPLAALCTIGCRHALRGGCTMCDYGFATERPSVEKQLREADEALTQIEQSNFGYDDYGFFNINAVGSFFDDNEMYPEVRRHILERIAANKSKHLLVEMATETRLEFITEEKLKEMREIL
ncbi:MAG: hypothetical protein NTU97_02980, partial [Candidatus Magasanikbacteria bacterium]|nr:hypothetical protein [Candidatus Magasanikbacteria bacterium]